MPYLGFVWWLAVLFAWGFPEAYQVYASESAFLELKSEHFVVKYTLDHERDLARRISIRAEELYRSVTSRIGYTRYEGGWTWDSRANIVIYPDQFSYVRWTGQSRWSKGYATRNSVFFRNRTIVTYDGQDGVAEVVLPHEVAHLVWWDFIGSAKVPVWFEEGVAQLEEPNSREMVQSAMRNVITSGQSIPFELLASMDPSVIQETTKVSIFYAQSLSILIFLIDRYGQSSFQRLCREFREGQSVDDALKRAYPGIINSAAQLEEKWKKDIAESPILTGGVL